MDKIVPYESLTRFGGMTPRLCYFNAKNVIARDYLRFASKALGKG